MRDIKMPGFEFKNKPEGGWYYKVNGFWIGIAFYAVYYIYCAVAQ